MASNVRDGRSGSSSSSSASTCTRLTPAPVALSPSLTMDYDCTNCGSFLFGQRGRMRPRPHGVRSHHHPRANRAEDTGQAHAQRLLLVGPSPVHHPFSNAVSQHLVVPQNEQLSSYQHPVEGEDPRGFLDMGFQNDISDTGSIQGSDDEGDEVSNERVIDYVACHGSEPVLVENVNDASSTLAEIFRCFICLGKVVDAQLCPCCSKLVCHPCIKRWLTDQKSECPHCRAPLLVSQLVSCRFISEISLEGDGATNVDNCNWLEGFQEVEKIQGKLGDNALEKYCPTHDSPLLYFCTTCSVAVCSDCAVLVEDHRNHTFEKLSVAYGRHKKKIRVEAAGLRRRRKELSALVASVDKNIESVLKSKDESAVELQVAFKRMQSRLEEQLKCKLLALLAQKGSMTQEMELLETILHELDQQLNSIPKSDLIAQEPNMSSMLQDIRTRTFSDISRTPISPDFTSEVVPAYEYGELVLKNYKTNLSQVRPTVFGLGGSHSPRASISFSKDVVFSEPVCASGVTWRLKVYPNGSGASQGTHLSVFLEMVEGGNEPATYEYGIELLHRSRPNQRVVRKFSSDFEAGACWGYYQFFRIDLLEKDGYLLPEEDTITLRFYVRALTYQQQCQDLRRALATIQVERDDSATQVAVIRRAFAATFFQRRRRRNSRAVHADGQPSFAQAVAGAVTNLASPTLGTRKAHMSSIKHFHLKMQDYSGSKSGKLIPGMWANTDNQRNMVNSEVSRSAEFAAALEGTDCITSPVHASEPNVQHSFGEESIVEFLARSEHMNLPGVCLQDDEELPQVEHVGIPIDARARERREVWLKKREDFFQLPAAKCRLHKKLRNRKGHKLLLSSEAMPFGDVTELAGQLSILSVEAGPSVMNTSSPTTSSNIEKSLGILSLPVVSISEERKHTPREKYREYTDPECQSSTPWVLNLGDSGAVNGGRETETKASYNFPSTASAPTGSLCTPEIEDWGNVK